MTRETTSAAERQRRYRARRSKGTVVVSFALPAPVIDHLIARGFIAADARESREAVREGFMGWCNAKLSEEEME